MTATLRSKFVVAAMLAVAGCQTKTLTTSTHTATTRAMSNSSTPASKPVALLTDDEKAKNLASFDQVWTTVRDKHFDPNYNGVDWNAVRDELRPREQAATTMDEGRGVMQEMLERLGETHFEIIPASIYQDVNRAKGKATKAATTAATTPATSAATAQRDADDLVKDDVDDDEPDPMSETGSTGISLRLVDGKMLVTKVDAASGAEKAGVKTGWELTSIREKQVSPLVEKIGKAIKAPGMRSAMQARLVESTMSGKIGATVDATFLDATNQPVVSHIVLGPPVGTASKFGNLPTLYVWTEGKRVDGDVEYFGLNIFLNPGAVMPKFVACVKDAVGKSEANAPAKGFILDLRGNPGGIGFMATGMSNYLIDKPNLKLGEMTGREGRGLKFILDPQTITYKGPVAILIDECSMSTSEILAGGLQDIGRARVFGVHSPGAALPSTVEKLPNGDRFQYAVANYISAGGKTLEGNGVKPDDVVEPERAALLAGHDPILDAAVKWIETQ